MVTVTREPFLSYLTVFRSRLGLINLVLDVTSFGHQPERTVHRRIVQALKARVELALDDTENDSIFQYLLDKKIVGANFRTAGRYRGVTLTRADSNGWQARSLYHDELTTFAVYQTDIWFAAPDMASTIGVPTPDNAREVIDFAYQLRILDRAKNSWTHVAHLINGLRRLSSDSLTELSNPFVLGAESAAILRTVLERDGLFLRELLRFLSTRNTVRRDEVAEALPAIAADSVRAATELGLPSQVLAEGRKFASSLAETDSGGHARAPGVREHRSSPRLEWLTDLGYLSKEGIAKNSFDYHVTSQVGQLVALLDSAISPATDWNFAAAISAWRINQHWHEFRSSIGVADIHVALGIAYSALRRPIGPAPLRDVAFIAAMLCPEISANEADDEIIALTKAIPGASLSGGRLTRSPENIYMTDESLRFLAENGR